MTEPRTDKTDVTPVPETLWYEERGYYHEVWILL